MMVGLIYWGKVSLWLEDGIRKMMVGIIERLKGIVMLWLEDGMRKIMMGII